MWIKIEQMSEFGKHLGKKVAVGITENSLSKEESGTIVQDPEMGVCVLTERGTRIPLDGTMMNKLDAEDRAVFMWAAHTEAVFPEGAAIHTGAGGETPVGANGAGEQANLPSGDNQAIASNMEGQADSGPTQELNQAATADEVQT